MTAPNTAEPTTPSTPSLDSWAADQFGELPIETDGESPEPESTSAAGTTPAEHPTGPDTGAEGKAADSTASSAGTTPETPAAETDPFADSTPLTVQANGQTVTYDGIRVFKEGGAVIKQEALQDVMQKLSERESLQGRFHTQSQEYQTLNRVLEWTGPDNRKYSGPEAAIEMWVGNAALLAENQLLVDAVIKSGDLREMLMTQQVPDGNGGIREVVVFRPEAIERLQRENALNAREKASEIREHYKGLLTQPAHPEAVNYEAEAPSLIASVAKAANLDAAVLTPADRTLLAKQLEWHTKDGKVSTAWQDLVTDRIALRVEQKANATKLVTTTADATKIAAERMAAAARGVKPPVAVTPTAPSTPSKPKKNEQAESQATAWDIMEKSGAAALRQAL